MVSDVKFIIGVISERSGFSYRKTGGPYETLEDALMRIPMPGEFIWVVTEQSEDILYKPDKKVIRWEAV